MFHLPSSIFKKFARVGSFFLMQGREVPTRNSGMFLQGEAEDVHRLSHELWAEKGSSLITFK